MTTKAHQEFLRKDAKIADTTIVDMFSAINCNLHLPVARPKWVCSTKWYRLNKIHSEHGQLFSRQNDPIGKTNFEIESVHPGLQLVYTIYQTAMAKMESIVKATNQSQTKMKKKNIEEILKFLQTIEW